LIAIILRDIGIEGAEEFFLFSSAVMATNILLTGLVALIENRIVSSESKYRLAYDRAEFYKDLFVHDINNILQNLEFSLELMSKECENYEVKEEMKELLILAKTQVNRGAELGVNVRKLSDLELGKIKTNPVQVNEILANAINYVKSRYIDKDIDIVFDSKEKVYMVNAGELLYEVFRIILNNTIRYNDSPTIEVIVKVFPEQLNDINHIRIEFLDNGIGMPDELKEKIFYKIYETPKSCKRIGLGLLLAREAIQNFNGKVWAEDRIKGDHEKGSKIIILIPETL
jgi:signal transduction histidine kinase